MKSIRTGPQVAFPDVSLQSLFPQKAPLIAIGPLAREEFTGAVVCGSCMTIQVCLKSKLLGTNRAFERLVVHSGQVGSVVLILVEHYLGSHRDLL